MHVGMVFEKKMDEMDFISPTVEEEKELYQRW